MILDIHGLGCNAAIEDEGTNMRALGDQNGFVVIQPNAPAASWDPSETFGPLVYDFTQTAAAAMAADLHRLYVMGFSEGGAMTWWEICAHADVFAAAAPTSAGGVDGCTFIGTDVPPSPIPILDTHGELDNVVSYTLFGVPSATRRSPIGAMGRAPSSSRTACTPRPSTSPMRAPRSSSIATTTKRRARSLGDTATPVGWARDSPRDICLHQPQRVRLG